MKNSNRSLLLRAADALDADFGQFSDRERVCIIEDLRETAKEDEPDGAAVVGIVLSLDKSAHAITKHTRLSISDAYAGGDEFMRQCLRVAKVFELWACKHVDFERTEECWPYFLQNLFGDAVTASGLGILNLKSFGDAECLVIANHLKLPLLNVENQLEA